LTWLRRQCAVVSQEPVLFAGSVVGREGGKEEGE
jgi:ABC-type bacteriocin/lantibiotic exporter with double-glycine peptidase domain